MKIRFLTQIADLAGTREIELKLQNEKADIETVLIQLANMLEDKSSAFLVPGSSQLQDEVYLLLNGRHLATLNGLKTQVCDEDTIHIIPVTEAG